MSGSPEQRRKELADFLKTRRNRVTPEEAGLPRDPQRRRTPGLRREEVAVLSGISLPWYTALEQGRDIRVSEQLLESLIRTLKLDADERNHLYSLALEQVPLPAAADVSEDALAGLQQIVDRLNPFPAYVYDSRWNVRVWNRMSMEIFGDFGAMNDEERNILWLIFTANKFRERFVQWEPIARNILAQFRSVYGRNTKDSWYRSMAERLGGASGAFSEWWGEHEVRGYPDGSTTYVHPQAGPLLFKASSMALLENPNLTLKVMCPVPETGTEQKLADLMTDNP